MSAITLEDNNDGPEHGLCTVVELLVCHHLLVALQNLTMGPVVAAVAELKSVHLVDLVSLFFVKINDKHHLPQVTLLQGVEGPSQPAHQASSSRNVGVFS